MPRLDTSETSVPSQAMEMDPWGLHPYAGDTQTSLHNVEVLNSILQATLQGLKESLTQLEQLQQSRLQSKELMKFRAQQLRFQVESVQFRGESLLHGKHVIRMHHGLTHYMIWRQPDFGPWLQQLNLGSAQSHQEWSDRFRQWIEQEFERTRTQQKELQRLGMGYLNPSWEHTQPKLPQEQTVQQLAHALKQALQPATHVAHAAA